MTVIKIQSQPKGILFTIFLAAIEEGAWPKQNNPATA
jgi:hypothetical protein